MSNRVDWNQFSDKSPTRQGFYLVKLINKDEVGTPEELVAEWRERSKAEGKRWWVHTSEDPTVEKTPKPLEGVVAWAKATQQQIDAALRRSLTKDELVEKAYQAYLNTASLYPKYEPVPPVRRQLQVHDVVEYGAHKEVYVEAVKDEGRVLVVSYRNIRNSYGKDIDMGIAYAAVHWLDVLKLKPVERLHAVAKQPVLRSGFANRQLDGVLREVLHGLDDSPDFQRGYVWTEEDQQRYLDALIHGRDIGRFIFVEQQYPKRPLVLDGKQRLNCLSLFVRSELPWRGIYWDEMTPRTRDELMSRTVQTASIQESRYTRADLLRIFLEVNEGGVPQTPEHLDKVRALLAEEEAKK